MRSVPQIERYYDQFLLKLPSLRDKGRLFCAHWEIVERKGWNPRKYISLPVLDGARVAQLKLRSVLSNHDLTKVRRVRDIGCGPGTNTRHFLSCDYLGIDFFNEEIQSPAPSGGCTSPTAS